MCVKQLNAYINIRLLRVSDLCARSDLCVRCTAECARKRTAFARIATYCARKRTAFARIAT